MSKIFCKKVFYKNTSYQCAQNAFLRESWRYHSEFKNSKFEMYVLVIWFILVKSLKL